MDKVSYALGLSMGHNFIGTGIKDLNIDEFAKGVRSVYEGTGRIYIRFMFRS